MYRFSSSSFFNSSISSLVMLVGDESCI